MSLLHLDISGQYHMNCTPKYCKTTCQLHVKTVSELVEHFSEYTLIICVAEILGSIALVLKKKRKTLILPNA